MAYGFRLRIHLREVGISSDQPVLTLTDESAVETVRLAAVKLGDPINRASELQVSGKRYDSADEAGEAGNRWRGVLEKAFARNQIGANFGLRSSPGMMFTHEALTAASNDTGSPVLNDYIGLHVFALEPTPVFLYGSATVHPVRQAEALVETIRVANSNNVYISRERERIAYELYSASSAMLYPDARFLLLMMALETLIDQKERPAKTLAHIDSMIAATEAAGLDSGETESLIAALRQQKIESVGRAGRQLVKETLAGRQYQDHSPQQFFQACYELRSRLVHGAEPRPAAGDVDSRAAGLEVLVGDLLSLGLPEA